MLKHTIYVLVSLALGVGAGLGLCHLVHKGAPVASKTCDGCHCKSGGWCCCGGTCKPRCNCPTCDCHKLPEALIPPTGVIPEPKIVTSTNVGTKELLAELKKHRGKVTLVEIWGSWCGPCRRQTPKTIALHAAKGFKFDLVLLSVAERRAESPVTFLKQIPGSDKATVLNFTGDLSDLATPLSYQGYVPYLILLDKKGALYVFSEETLDTLLKE